MKRILLTVLLSIFLVSFNSPSAVFSIDKNSTGEVLLLKIGSQELWANGQESSVMDVTPFIENNRTWVPVRFVSEALGAEVGWNQDKQQVTISMGEIKLILTIGSNSLLANGKSQTMDVAPFLRNNRTWVPLRFVAENLGCSVSWVQGSQEVVIRRGTFSGSTVAFVQNGRLIMQEVSGNSPGSQMILAGGNVTGEEISGPLAWSPNGLKIAYYRIQRLNFDFFRLNLEYQIIATRASTSLLSRDKAYGGLKALSWSPGDAYILYDEPTSDVSGTLWLVMVEEQDATLLGEEGEVIYGTFSPDGFHQAWLTFGDEGISVLVLDQEGVQMEINDVQGGFTWSPDGGSLAVNTSQGIEIYDVNAPAMPPEVYAFPGQAFDLVWSPDRGWIAGSCSEGTFALNLGWGEVSWWDEIPGGPYIIDNYHPSAPAGFLPSGELIIEHKGEHSSGASNYYLFDPRTHQLTFLLKNAEHLAVRP